MSERASTKGRVSAREQKVLVALAGAYDPYEWRAFNFKGIAGRCDVEPHLIRRVTRSLARKGFAQFERSLWCDDGMPAGAGYRCTQAGFDLISGAMAAQDESSGRNRADANPTPDRGVTAPVTLSTDGGAG